MYDRKKNSPIFESITKCGHFRRCLCRYGSPNTHRTYINPLNIAPTSSKMIILWKYRDKNKPKRHKQEWSIANRSVGRSFVRWWVLRRDREGRTDRGQRDSIFSRLSCKCVARSLSFPSCVHMCRYPSCCVHIVYTLYIYTCLAFNVSFGNIFWW